MCAAEPAIDPGHGNPVFPAMQHGAPQSCDDHLTALELILRYHPAGSAKGNPVGPRDERMLPGLSLFMYQTKVLSPRKM